VLHVRQAHKEPQEQLHVLHVQQVNIQTDQVHVQIVQTDKHPQREVSVLSVQQAHTQPQEMLHVLRAKQVRHQPQEQQHVLLIAQMVIKKST